MLILEIVSLFLALAAVNASPHEKRQAVTARITPTAAAPPTCSDTYSGTFGIAVKNVTSTSTASKAKRQVATQAHDGQPAVQTLAPMSQISDGQLQVAKATMVMMPVANQIHDGQVQLQTTMAQVTQYKDGQPQAPTFTAAPTRTASAVGQQKDAQPTAAVASHPSSSSAALAPSSVSANSGNKMITCSSGFSIKLDHGVLTDQAGRTGYIASNYQLQFDKPPQAGAIYTAGFSQCSNGSLALGGSSIFYQCLSGKFYNLYDRSWAAQCSPVYIDTLRQVAC